MNPRTLMVLIAATIIAADNPKDDAVKKDLDKLKGTWLATSYVKDAKPAPEPDLKMMKLVIAGDQRLTYSQLVEQTARLASALEQMGLQPEQRVLILLPDSVEFVVAYLGVVPEQRGRGYAGELLAEASAFLAGQGAGRIRADTDVANAPMAAAFERAGYDQFAIRIDLVAGTPA